MEVTGCGEQPVSQSSDSVEAPPVRYAELMSAKEFRETFKARGRMHSFTDSADEELRASLVVRKIDGEENVFHYDDVTGELDLKDLDDEKFIPDFLKGLNRSSDSCHYSDMKLIDRGDNFYEFKVSITTKEAEEAAAAEKDTEDSLSAESEVKKTERAGSDGQSGEAEEELSSEKETPEALVQDDSRPMLFLFVKQGKKTLELIGLDLEAENAEAFSDSFLEILDEIVTVREEPSEGSS